jgi:soluble P-type ATPase
MRVIKEFIRELRVVLQSNDKAQTIRQQIDLLGLQKNSVIDTNDQVASLSNMYKIG